MKISAFSRVQHTVVGVSVLACVLVSAGMASAGPLAQAAPATSWGYSSALQPDGTIDFSGWNVVAVQAAGVTLGSIDFSRDSLNFAINVNIPKTAPSGQELLVANVVVNKTGGQSWTYAFSSGSGGTGGVWYTDSTTSRAPVSIQTQSYYTKSDSTHLAVGVTGTASIDGAQAPQLQYSEILDVAADGSLTHHLTLTNTSVQPLSHVGFSALLDTDLNGNDAVPIVANGNNSVSIASTDVVFYLEMLTGDQMLVGPWGNRSNLSGFVSANGQPTGTVLLTSVDSSVSYGTKPADLASGASVSLAFGESLYASSEIGTVTIAYVDDSNNGAAVVPVAGTPTILTGQVGSAVGFTQAAAQAGVPAGYVFSSIDNVTNYAAGSQTITVHLRSGSGPNPTNTRGSAPNPRPTRRSTPSSSTTTPSATTGAVSTENSTVTPDTTTGSLTGGAARLADGSDSYTLTATLVDAAGHPLTGLAETLTASSVPDGVAFGGFTDNGDGTYSVNVTSDTPGNYSVMVQQAGQSIGSPAAINFIGGDVGASSVTQAKQQSGDGLGFLPGEVVHIIVHSDPIDLGSVTADKDGKVPVAFMVPSGFSLGDHTIQFVGAKSGAVSVAFKVAKSGTLVDTGGGLASGIGAGLIPGLLLLTVGLGVVVLKTRRQTA